MSRGRRRHAPRWAKGAIATADLVGCGLLSVDRLLAPESTVAVVAIVLMPWALPGYLFSLGISLWLRRSSSGRARRWWTGSAVVALAGALLQAAWAAPAYLGRHPSQEPTLTVLQLNTWKGQADPAAVVQLVRDRDADVVVLEELDAAAASRLAAAGLERVLPHRAGDPDRGVMVFSRWPLRHAEQLPVSKGGVRVEVAAPRPFWLVGLHTTQPLMSTTGWLRDLREVRRVVARTPGSRVVVGDFNATVDHGPMRALFGSGLRDAAERANAGFQPTWPSGDAVRVLGVPIPVSLATLDHVLVSRRFGVVATRTIAVSGSDHKALVVGLVH
jgi:endonuclease/exonuclease/phosphatase (EEP) superfamily protein YafD